MESHSPLPARPDHSVGRPWLPWLLALASGVLLGGCFPPWDLKGLSLIPWTALSPLCWALWMLPRRGTPKAWALRAFLLGWVTGTVSFLISLFWITTVTVFGWVALSLFVGLYPALWALFSGVVLRRLALGDEGRGAPSGESAAQSMPWMGSFRNLSVALLAAAAWTGMEFLRGRLFTGFGWNPIGIGLLESIPLIQIAGVTGAAGLSFLCVLGASTATITARRLGLEIQRRRSKPHLDFLLVVLVVALLFGHGVRKITAPPVETQKLKVAGVQGNVPVYDYWDPKCEGAIIEGYLRQSRLALTMDPDLVVWPEAATPRPLLLDEIIFSQVKELASGTRADFLIGSIHYEAEPRGDFNSAILLRQHAASAQIYNKVHLVPFGEYVPFRHLFPPLMWIIGNRVPFDFDPGKGPALLELSVKPVKIGPLICFEDTLGDLTRGFADLGAQLLVTLTNDGWFEHSVATRQHLANARLRTVETGLPLLRVADTGVTCLVDRFGRLRDTLAGPDGSTFVEGVLQVAVDVPLHPEKTFYTRHGELFAEGCLGLTLLAIGAFVGLVRFRRQHPTSRA